MRLHLPWFAQGDILREIPIVATALHESGGVVPHVSRGPALLLTHGCTLDKATGSGRPTIKRLHFAPLIAVDQQDRARQAVLRTGALQPYEVMYLGVCGALGESFIVLSEAYYLPMEFFQPTLQAWEGHPDAISGDRYLTPGRNGDRVGRLDDSQLDLLLSKINAFWTRRLMKDDDLG